MSCSECDGYGVKVICPDDACRAGGECRHGDGDMVCPNCVDGDTGDDDDHLDIFDPEPCGCKYCPCVLTTEYGEPCRDCENGAHQG